MRTLLFVIVTFCCFHAQAEEVSVPLQDGYPLSGNLLNPDSRHAVLLLHQCNRDQTMWQPLVSRLTEAGFGIMTVDFRGYGKSKSDEYDVDRSDDDYLIATAEMNSDVVSIYQFWQSHTAKAEKRVLVGASCGGGGAGILASEFADIDALVLFSPSMRDYWFPEEKWPKLQSKDTLPILAIASKQDKNAMGAIDKATEKSQSPHTEYIRYNGRLHGQPLFQQDTNLADKMLNWIKRVTR